MLCHRGQFLKLEAQARAQMRPLTGKIGDGVAVEDVEEGTQGLPQSTVEVAIVGQGTHDVGATVETFRHREVLLGQLDRVEQRDLVGGTAETDATLASSHGDQQTGLLRRPAAWL